MLSALSEARLSDCVGDGRKLGASRGDSRRLSPKVPRASHQASWGAREAGRQGTDGGRRQVLCMGDAMGVLLDSMR